MLFLKAKDDSSVGPHRHCPETSIIAFQSMQVEAGQVQVPRYSGRIESHQDVPYGLAVIGTNAAFVAPLEKPP